ncbi:MAG: hypothetical protein RIC56_12320 [Pseudomonadales bacterium]
MKVRRGGGDAASAAPPVARRGELRQTLLLPLVFEGLDESRPVSVLDVGAGAAETLSFFSEHRCRLQFADLFEAPGLNLLPEDDPEGYFDALFAAHCAFPEDTRFDICLFWDFLNYLSVPALRSFSRTLAPYLHRDTVGHGFGAFKATAPAASWATPSLGMTYAIHDRDSLLVRPRPGGSVGAHPHSRTVLADAFDCFEIVRGTLLQEGAMELLLKAR